MRSAKTLLKMTEKEKALEILPKWFNGTVYELGDEVRNPFSGETCLLDAAELSMYEVIKGAEIAEDYDTVRKGLDKFSRMNAKAYMTLLD